VPAEMYVLWIYTAMVVLPVAPFYTFGSTVDILVHSNLILHDYNSISSQCNKGISAVIINCINDLVALTRLNIFPFTLAGISRGKNTPKNDFMKSRKTLQ
jgi:hypothetical protein